MSHIFDALLERGIQIWQAQNVTKDRKWHLRISVNREIIGIWSLPKTERDALLMLPHKTPKQNDIA